MFDDGSDNEFDDNPPDGPVRPNGVPSSSSRSFGGADEPPSGPTGSLYGAGQQDAPQAQMPSNPPPAESISVKNHWVCSTCTLENTLGAAECDACGERRPAGAVAAPPSALGRSAMDGLEVAGGRYGAGSGHPAGGSGVGQADGIDANHPQIEAPPRWVEDDDAPFCMNIDCGVEFDFFCRRHHW